MLKVFRQNAGYQQKQVAELLGHISPDTLCEWETTKRMPSAVNLIKLCVLYKKDISELYPEHYQEAQRDLLI
jgi:DNA-binding XRE family transcriptional regulator